MRNLNTKQIAEVKNIKAHTYMGFHANTKKVGLLPIADFKEIVLKKNKRAQYTYSLSKKTPLQVTRELIAISLESKNTNYFKIMIEGNSGIYYASAEYQHSDYNKSRLFEKNEETIKIMNLFNAIVNK